MRISRLFKQTAVYWAPSTPDGFGGRSYGTAVEKTVRWEDVYEKVMDADGNEFISKSKVWCATPLALNGYLYLGDEDSLDSTHDDPNVIDNCFEIRTVDAIPSKDGTQTLYLMRL